MHCSVLELQWLLHVLPAQLLSAAPHRLLLHRSLPATAYGSLRPLGAPGYLALGRRKVVLASSHILEVRVAVELQGLVDECRGIVPLGDVWLLVAEAGLALRERDRVIQ